MGGHQTGARAEPSKGDSARQARPWRLDPGSQKLPEPIGHSKVKKSGSGTQPQMFVACRRKTKAPRPDRARGLTSVHKIGYFV